MRALSPIETLKLRIAAYTNKERMILLFYRFSKYGIVLNTLLQRHCPEGTDLIEQFPDFLRIDI